MARYDKYEPKAGGFRAPLAEDWPTEDVNVLRGVGLDDLGRVVIGDGDSGIVGVCALTMVRNAGDVVDVMTSGEVVEFDGDPGTVYNAADDGSVGTAAGTRVGHTVEGSRLVVRVVPGGGA